mmetsp:Transcript_30716/g.30208  ORF Transcript_30716/g.30208 Transcript_30716/m.30208 type:complete len:207 (-) Transcript_30716:649-1269(-)
MCAGDHVDVVGAVADGEGGDGGVLLAEHHDDLGLLLGGDPTAQHRLRRRAQVQELIPHSLILRDPQKRVAPHDHTGLRAGHQLLVADEARDLDHDLLACGGVHHEDLHVLLQQRAGVPDVDGRLHLVPRQHPQLDPRLPDERYRLRHVVLQPVLDRCRTHQRKRVLQLLRRPSQHHLPVRKVQHRRLVLLVPSIVLLLRKRLLTNK